jgi:hypothetical protein
LDNKNLLTDRRLTGYKVAMPNENEKPKLDAVPDSVQTEFWVFTDERDVTTGMIALHGSPVEGSVVRMSVSAHGSLIDFDFSKAGVDDLIGSLQAWKAAAK